MNDVVCFAHGRVVDYLCEWIGPVLRKREGKRMGYDTNGLAVHNKMRPIWKAWYTESRSNIIIVENRTVQLQIEENKNPVVWFMDSGPRVY